MPHSLTERMARHILESALREHRCAELLKCLFDGGSVTIDANTHELVLVDAQGIRNLR